MPDAPRESFGPFQVRGDLGSGRFGPVYRAEATDTGEPVVVRTIRAALEPAQRRAFLDALQWLCETPLDHPSLGRPLACGIEGETPYLVQAFVPGTPLDEFLDRRGPQPVDDTLVRLTQLAGAIDFAAAAGVHHGALDRRDILLGAHHSAIVGLGLAQAAAQAGLLLEAHDPYQSPQQRAGEAPTAADDVYALAVVALQLLCGRAAGHDAPAALLATLEEAGLAQALQVVFEAALADDPGKRPPSALTFAARLQAALVPEAAGAPGAVGTATGDPGDVHAPAAGEPLADVAMRGEPDTTPVPVDALHPPSSTGPIDLPLLIEPDTRDPADRHGAPRLDDATWHGRGRSRRRGRPEDRVSRDRLQLDGDREPVHSGAHEASPTPASVPLPFDLGLGDSPGREVSHVGPRAGPESWTDAPAAAGGPSSMGDGRVAWADSGAFETLRPDSPRPVDRRPWLLIAAAMLVMAVTGVMVAWLVTRSTESVPFPRSAATLPLPGSEVPLASDLPDAGGPTRIPDIPTIPPPVPLPDVPDVIAEPLDPPGLSDAPAPAAPAVPALSDPPPSPAPARPATPPVQSPPPAEAPAEPGRILVRSTPGGAQVLVNGVPQPGTTPLPVRDLALGAYTVEVRHPQYAARQERVTLTAAAPARAIDFELDRPAAAGPAAPASAPAVLGALEVESRPAGAQVFVDDRLVGVTPIVVPGVAAGPRVVRLELPGYRRWTTSVTVAGGSRVRVAASLEP